MAVLRLDPHSPRHLELFAEIRLRALRTDPDAFGSSYEREVEFDAAAWRERLTGFAGHPGVAFGVDVSRDDTRARPHPDALIGVVGVGLPDPREAAIWGMWVAPEARRGGLANTLLDAAERWAADAGAQTTTLWVHRTNSDAQVVYRRRGYDLVDAHELPSDVPPACNDEICMRLRLTLA